MGGNKWRWLVAFVASSKGIFCKEGIIKGALWAWFHRWLRCFCLLSPARVTLGGGGVTLSDSHDVPKKTPLINDDLWWSPFKGFSPVTWWRRWVTWFPGYITTWKKTYVQKITAFAKPTSAWKFEFLVHIYKAKSHIIIALFFLEKTMLFSCFTPPAKQASINGNHSPCGNTRLHVPTSRFLPRNCNRKRGQRWDPSAWGILVDRDFGARKKITKRKHWFLLEGFWSTGFLWVIFKSGLF